MRQIWIVLKQEYLNRVRKRSFIIMTLMGPVISLFILFIPLYLSLDTNERIHVWLSSAPSENIHGNYSDQLFVFHPVEQTDTTSALTTFLGTQDQADVLVFSSGGNRQVLYWDKRGLNTTERWKLESKLQQIHTVQALHTYAPQAAVAPVFKMMAMADKKNESDVPQMAALFAAVLIYFFIFYYGVQVMKGIVDEKSSRVVEVILCSVKPVQWMTGKILGIASVSVTQFSFWLLIYGSIWLGVSSSYGDVFTQFSDGNIQQTMLHTGDASMALEWNRIVEGMESIPFMVLGLSFIAYFIFGYLFYASLFAAVGAMTDNETDTQQFTFPITAPLFITFLFAGLIISDPYAPIGVFLSYFPLTSPVAMLLRIPLGIPLWEVVLSVTILALTFVLTSYLAAHVFKRGILQYGKTLGWKDVLGRNKKA